MNESNENGKPDWRETVRGLMDIALFTAWAATAVLFMFAFAADDHSLRDVLLALGAVIGAPAGLWLSYRRTIALDQQNRNTEKSLTQQAESERNTRLATAFTKATNQLGNKKEHIRAAACHALGQIALEDYNRNENPAYYANCIEILSGFLRDRCSKESERFASRDIRTIGPDDHRLPVDIEAALSSVSSCNSASEGAHPIDLQGADLRCWEKLTRALDLRKSNLRWTNLDYVCLSNCKLDSANFQHAYGNKIEMHRCSLVGTVFELYYTSSIQIAQSIISGVDLYYLGCEDAYISESIIRNCGWSNNSQSTHRFFKCIFDGGNIRCKGVILDTGIEEPVPDSSAFLECNFVEDSAPTIQLNLPGDQPIEPERVFSMVARPAATMYESQWGPD